MSIATEISRIQADKNKIRNKAVELGIGKATDGLDELADAIDLVENQGAVNAEVKEGESYTIPKGYHSGSGTVKGVAGGGNYSLQAKTATPTKKQQSVTPDAGYYGLSGVTIAPIPDAYQDVTAVTAGAADVLANKIIVDATGKSIAGTMASNGDVTSTMDGMTSTSVTIPAGYTTGGTVSLTTDIEEALAAI